MTPQELAMMCANASTKCEKYKCPFAAKCKGSYETCVMKEIAMIIRANDGLQMESRRIGAIFDLPDPEPEPEEPGTPEEPETSEEGGEGE